MFTTKGLGIKKIRIRSFLEYGLALLIMLNCRSIWLYLTTTRVWFYNLCTAATYFLIVLSVVFSGKVTKKAFNRSLFLLVYMLFFALFNRYNWTNYLVFIVSFVFLFSLLINNRRDAYNLLIKYKTIVFYVAIFSCTFWILVSVLGILHPNGIAYSMWTGTKDARFIRSFYGMYFDSETAITILGPIKLKRNFAFFSEPPMASLHFSFGLLIEMFLENKNTIKKKLMFSIAILSTGAITGYVLLIFAWTLSYFLSDDKNSITKKIKIASFPFLFSIGLCIVYFFLQFKVASLSGITRIDDFVVGYKVWHDHFLFGAGYNNSDVIYSYMGSWRANNLGFSNSLMQMLAQGGCFMAVLYLLPIVRGYISAINKHAINEVVLISLVLYLFAFTVCTYQYVIFLFLFFFWIQK